jgi:phage/plasmid-like protein (TIGR03299 family)
MKTLVKNVTERVVCANTLSIAVGEKGKAVKVSHRSEFNADSVKAQLGISVAAFQKFIVDARELSRVPMSKEESDKFLLHLFSDLDPAVEHDPKLLTAAREYVGYRKVMDLFTTSGRGSQLPGVKGTAWGLLNGVTEYVDHARGNKATTQDNRLDYAWFGAGDALKTKAFEQAMALTA